MQMETVHASLSTEKIIDYDVNRTATVTSSSFITILAFLVRSGNIEFNYTSIINVYFVEGRW